MTTEGRITRCVNNDTVVIWRLPCLGSCCAVEESEISDFPAAIEGAKCAASAEEALSLLASTLNTVEDEFSGIPPRPQSWQDGRMYPPQEDNRYRVSGCPSLCRYRSREHNTFIGLNGSVRIETCGAKPGIVLDKPGADGRKTHDLDV